MALGHSFVVCDQGLATVTDSPALLAWQIVLLAVASQVTIKAQMAGALF